MWFHEIMKIGLLTYHHVENYGALWQCQSLFRHLEAMGHSPEVIDYRPTAATRQYFYHRIRSRHILQNHWKTLLFHWERSDALRLSPNTHRSQADLMSSRLKYDAVIVGSDEVWSPRTSRGFDSAYFLDFLSHDTPRISYAACMGGPFSYGTHEDLVSNALSKFMAISVRDKTTQDMVRQLAGRQAQIVVDPTLLAGERKQTTFGGYCAIYGSLSSEWKAWLRQNGHRFRLPFVSLGSSNRVGGINKVGIGLNDWLQTMGSSSLILTTTFHGTLAAILHRVPFWVLPRPGGLTKLHDFLGRYELSDRYVEHICPTWNFEKPLNYDKLWLKLSNDIEASRAFLQYSLDNTDLNHSLSLCLRS
jgi:hypothetical protein